MKNLKFTYLKRRTDIIAGIDNNLYNKNLNKKFKHHHEL
jgi:hypothetical protein